MELNQRMVAVILLVIVLVVVVLFIIHAVKIKKIPGNGGRVHVFGTYIVTVGPKSSSRFSSGSGPENCFYINGMEAPRLQLGRGVYYEFKNESDEPLYFSTSREGGRGAPLSLAKNQSRDFIGLANGTIFFMVTDDLPNTFYYQSGKSSWMGGIVEIR